MTWTNFKDNAKQLEVTLDHDDDSVDSKSIVLKPHKKKAVCFFFLFSFDSLGCSDPTPLARARILKK